MAGNVQVDSKGVYERGEAGLLRSSPVVPVGWRLDRNVQKIEGGAGAGITARLTGVEVPVTVDAFTRIHQISDPTFNYGASTAATLGGVNKARMLLRANTLTGVIPERILSAFLRLYTNESDYTKFNFGLLRGHVVSFANIEWQEGISTGGAGTLTDCTWNQRSVSPALSWAGSPGLSTEGVDYYSQPLFEMDFAAEGAAASAARFAYIQLDRHMFLRMIEMVSNSIRGSMLIFFPESEYGYGYNPYWRVTTDDAGTNPPRYVITQQYLSTDTNVQAGIVDPQRPSSEEIYVRATQPGTLIAWGEGATPGSTNSIEVPSTWTAFPLLCDFSRVVNAFIPGGSTIEFTTASRR